MFFIKRIRNWWLRKKTLAKLLDPDLSADAARDIGVTITRIRLPSGAEIVIVKPAPRDE